MRDKRYVLSTTEIAKQYSKWMDSEPFDIGEATSNALGPLEQNPRPAPRLAKQAAAEHNHAS